MKTFNKLMVLFCLLTIVFSCKKEKSECPTPVIPTVYETNIYEFQLVNKGNPYKGYCGPTIIAYLDSTKKSSVNFKAIDLPTGITNTPNTFYKGRFRILPEKYTCIDGVGDPFPGQTSRIIYPNFVSILEWEYK